MKQFKLAVLKFGSSVLANPLQIHHAVHEVYRYVREGHRVIVIVSAIGNTTEKLIQLAEDIIDDKTEDKPEQAYANLLATGEIAASALFTLALDRAGIPALNLNYHFLKVQGLALDGEPHDLNINSIENLFASCTALVVPGFIGSSAQNQIHLLGRGGSDYSALYTAWALQATHCVLYKDTDGIYKEDPKQASKKNFCYQTLSYADCFKKHTVIQHKALQFAQEKNLSFIVKTLNSEQGTKVGNFPSSVLTPTTTPHRRLRVALLGLGTVGLGVFKRLQALSDTFEIVGVAVKNLAKHPLINPDLISDNIQTIVNRDCDIIIELIGGIEPAQQCIITALQQGKQVITANKSLIATQGNYLTKIAAEKNVGLYYSAAVGGSLPILETLKQLQHFSNPPVIKKITGVINGTCNYVLTKIRAGESYAAAVKAAQQAGFAEADPSFDVSGRDAAEKLTIISRLAFQADPENLSIQGIEAINDQEVQTLAQQNQIVQLIATCSKTEKGINAAVAPVVLPVSHPLAKVKNADNCLLIETITGETLHLYGKGAGRWPTTEAVIADLLEIVRKKSTISAKSHANIHATICEAIL
jgi:homoserine dehydrogenase